MGNSAELSDYIIDQEVLKHLRGGILLAAAAGIMVHLQRMEPAEHTKRARTLKKVEDAVYGLFDLYPKSDDYNMQDLGLAFFNDEHEDRLKRMFAQGVCVVPPTKEDIAKCKELGIEPKPRAVFKDRWKRGDVLQRDGKVIVIESVHPEEYHYVNGPALLYSKANHRKDPYLLNWKKVAALGENYTQEDFRKHVHQWAK